MAARSIASLSLSFGLVSIPVRLYSATESAASIGFKLLGQDGSRLTQQYVSEKDQKVVPRSEMLRGYEFEKDKFVLFTPDELKALEEGSRTTIDIVSFIPEKAVDPLYYDKAYLLSPDKRGGKPYELLRTALASSGRCALATWAWKAKSYVVQVRATDKGLILQQLRYAEEVRSLDDLNIEPITVSSGELQLALQIVEQSSEDAYDATKFEDLEKKRILAAIDAKIEGKEVVASANGEEPGSGQIIDLMDALRASLAKSPKKLVEEAPPVKLAAPAKAIKAPRKAADSNVTSLVATKERKPAKRALKIEEPAVEVAPVRQRGRK